MKSLHIFSLEGTAALITGAGGGIGRGAAEMLAKAGAAVAVTELPANLAAAEALVTELRSWGNQAIALPLDVKEPAEIELAVAKTVEEFGKLDILVNNAGIQLLKPALDMDAGEFDEVVRVNLIGAFLCARAAAAVMVKQGGGCIVNVASQHGVVGNKKRAAYCASKGGLVNLTRALAVEWAELNIRVNAVSPTFVVTESNRAAMESQEIRELIQRAIPLNRPATTKDVAAGICFLASPGARMITGDNLLIDGGWTAR
jgi:2-deoxy-D-gluconate 3-dehydrogenase